jgi:hypothetical protein
MRWGVPILTASRLTRIRGARRVDAVEVTELRAGTVRELACDTVVFSGDWIADHELARRGGLVMDAGTRAPRVDLALRTSRPGVFAAGNLLHGAETADIAALAGRHAARAAHAFLTSGMWPEAVLPVRCAPPLRWVAPNAIGAGDWRPPTRRFLLRVGELCPAVELVVTQGPHTLWRQRHRRLIPNLPIHLAADWLANVDRNGEAIDIAVRFI